MSGSLTSVEETLQKTQHQMESLSERRLDKMSGIIEESWKSFAETMQDVPSMVSHLKQVHATQKFHEEKILHLLSNLEQTEGDPKMPTSEDTFNTKIDQLAAKMDEDVKSCREDGTDKPMYIIVSYKTVSLVHAWDVNSNGRSRFFQCWV